MKRASRCRCKDTLALGCFCDLRVLSWYSRWQNIGIGTFQETAPKPLPANTGLNILLWSSGTPTKGHGSLHLGDARMLGSSYFQEKSKRWYEFLTSLFAILGGPLAQKPCSGWEAAPFRWDAFIAEVTVIRIDLADTCISLSVYI